MIPSSASDEPPASRSGPFAHHFQVDLHGVIQLLSDHLYSSPQVFLREMLQNAVDAITARQRLEPDHFGEISLNLVQRTVAGSLTAVLSITDNGIGLTEQEVHQFLATIGRSSKRDDLRRDSFLGQFGIGLLSGFLVSDEVVAITRSVKEDSPTVEFRGKSDGTYTVRTLPHDAAPGTQVFLVAKPQWLELFEAESLLDAARYYGVHLPYQIELTAGQQLWRIDEPPPWRIEFVTAQARRDALLEYGRRAFGEEFLDAVPLRWPKADVDGVAFVLAHPARISGRHEHRVYLKNMLLSETADNLLPEWAFFVKCTINASGLRPNAARESFYEDEQLSEARTALGGCLRDYLMRLAATDREMLDQIIELHYLSIKALACEDDEFLRLFIDWLPFETSLGTMTLGQCFEHSSSVRYVAARDQFRQIANIAAAQGICIVNAGYAYDLDLLAKVPELFEDRSVIEVDANELVDTFGELTPDEQEQAQRLVHLAGRALQAYQCVADIRKFAPQQLPALYTISETATFLRSIEQSQEVADPLWSGILDGLASEVEPKTTSQLCLNFNNPLVRRMMSVTDAPLLQQLVEMLYVQALLLGHYPLKAREMKLLSSGLMALMERSIGTGEERSA